jgi:uncharacterized membrane protein
MRDIEKTITYSVMHFAIAFTVAYLISGDLRMAMAISLIEPAVQTVAYFFHEKAWKKAGEKTKLSF